RKVPTMTNARPSHIGAVDLGASSGRVMVGTITDGRIELTETRRFSNGPIPLPGPDGERLYWDVLHLWDEIRAGLLTAVRDVGPLAAVGIDTWGVDYGLLGPGGLLAGQVSAYRCPRTRGIPDELFAAIPAAELYAVNGLQVQDFNTVFQLVAESRDGGLPRSAASVDGDAAPAASTAQRTMLLLPDLLTYWLTGKPVAEITNASTTGLVDARERNWSTQLLQRLRTELDLILDGVLPDIVEAGTVIGPVRRDVVDVFGPDGAPTPVVAVGSHDTASAVAAVPAAGDDFAYISCGTWSLVGLELDAPVLTEPPGGPTSPMSSGWTAPRAT
ncbi:FGGY family carbohydrate kinase, partial [Actinomyces ruminis]|uniref:FGGY family carbohydrate kinase n=1 Tax=Actinomyces ruminis TaxID=1937003 RepID=UPI0030B8400B